MCIMYISVCVQCVCDIQYTYVYPFSYVFTHTKVCIEIFCSKWETYDINKGKGMTFEVGRIFCV